MRKNKLWALITLLIFITVIFAGCGQEKEQEQSEPEIIVLKMGTHYNTEHYITKGYFEFEKEVEANSNGRIDVQIFHSSSIIKDDRQAVQLLSDNSVQIAHSECSMIGTVINDKRWESLSIPYYFGTEPQVIYNILDNGKAFSMLSKDLEGKVKIKVIGTANGGSASISNTKKSIESMEDFKGLKIRVPESKPYLEPIKLWGANPTPMNFGEIYTSLQQKAIDGVFTSKTAIVDFKFPELCKYHTNINPFLLIFTFGINTDFYNSLPSDMQKIVLEASDNMIKTIREGAVEKEKSLDEALVQQGVKVVNLSPQFQSDLQKAVAPYVEERKAEIAEYIKIVDEDIKNLK
ncbi:MAG: hypothetical protein CVU87_02060 [Firmicutes bacterium HGW-Firmicutes-12]|jgi:TRAP-type C4-dicarboxylate transport system substrate-binding protein|nr:MAG: hypothetical protein CVU87_02060 [Firmicutes bacterium HGW-Firmicutes-12]